MLYELMIEEPTELDDPRCHVYVIEAPDYTFDKGVVIPQALMEWCYKRVHEASVMWDFATVTVSLSRYFPAHIDKDGEVTSCTSSLLREWTDTVEKVVSR